MNYRSASGSYRVYRGGCWFDGPQCARVAYRLSYSPVFHYFSLGVRLVRRCL